MFKPIKSEDQLQQDSPHVLNAGSYSAYYSLMPTATERHQRTEISDELCRLEVELTEPQEEVVFSFLTSNPSCTVPTALRFCYARKFDLARIQTLFNNYMSAVEKSGLSGITVNDVLEELRTAKLYCPGGRDKEGAGLFVICARNHRSKQFPMESTLRLAFYLAELVTSHPKTQRNGLTLICDLDGVEWSQFDSAFIQRITSFFQNNVPCSIKHILLYKPPWWVNMLVKMVTPFLKEKMRQRIKICKEEKDLEEVVSKDQLPEQLGGKMQYDHDYFIRNELSKINRVFASKAMQTRREREEADMALVEPPKNAKYLVESKVVRDALLNERNKELEALNERLRAEALKSPIQDVSVILEMLRRRETRKLIDVWVVMHNLEHPQPGNAPILVSEKTPIQPVANIQEKKDGEGPATETIESEPARKYSRRVSRGLQPTQSIDFEAEALKLDKQRRASRSMNM